MRRALFLLAALGAVLPAFSQASLSVSLSGGVRIADQDGHSTFEPDGAGYDVLTIRGVNEEATFGFSVTDENLLSRITYIKSVAGVDADSDGQYDRIDTTTGKTHSLDIRDWNVWYRLFGGRAKVSAGVIRSTDYRTTLPNWYTVSYGGTDLVFAQGLLAQAYPAPGLSLGVFLPIGTAEQDFVSDTLGGADLGVSYSIRNVGIVKALVRLGQGYSLDLNGDGDETDPGEAVSDAVMVNAGFTFTAVDGLLASVLGRVIRSREADALFWYGAAGFDYALTPKWALRAEGAFARRPEYSGITEAPLLGTYWDLWARARYRITDKLYTHATWTWDQDGDWSLKGALGCSFGEGLGVSTHLGWAGRVLWDLYVYYAVAF